LANIEKNELRFPENIPLSLEGLDLLQVGACLQKLTTNRGRCFSELAQAKSNSTDVFRRFFQASVFGKGC
jgi:hypothetical protein